MRYKQIERHINVITWKKIHHGPEHQNIQMEVIWEVETVTMTETTTTTTTTTTTMMTTTTTTRMIRTGKYRQIHK